MDVDGLLQLVGADYKEVGEMGWNYEIDAISMFCTVCTTQVESETIFKIFKVVSTATNCAVAQ